MRACVRACVRACMLVCESAHTRAWMTDRSASSRLQQLSQSRGHRCVQHAWWPHRCWDLTPIPHFTCLYNLTNLNTYQHPTHKKMFKIGKQKKHTLKGFESCLKLSFSTVYKIQNYTMTPTPSTHYSKCLVLVLFVSPRYPTA